MVLSDLQMVTHSALTTTPGDFCRWRNEGTEVSDLPKVTWSVAEPGHSGPFWRECQHILALPVVFSFPLSLHLEIFPENCFSASLSVEVVWN